MSLRRDKKILDRPNPILEDPEHMRALMNWEVEYEIHNEMEVRFEASWLRLYSLIWDKLLLLLLVATAVEMWRSSKLAMRAIGSNRA